LDAPRKDSPSIAFWLSLVGGVIVLLAGVVVTAFGAALSFVLGGLGELGEIFGLAGVIWGVLIVLFASLLRSMPDRHVGFGVLIILFSMFSWFGAFGGFAIGFLLSLVGGILAILWKPEVPLAEMPPAPSPPPPAATATTPGPVKFCPNCGTPVEVGEKFCKICGKAL